MSTLTYAKKAVTEVIWMIEDLVDEINRTVKPDEIFIGLGNHHCHRCRRIRADAEFLMDMIIVLVKLQRRYRKDLEELEKQSTE